MKLLFVEDEYYTRTGILQSIDWAALGIDQVDNAGNGREGLQKLRERPDLLLTDIRMPFVTGLDIARQLKRDDPDSEVVILSSYSDKEYLLTAISLSAVSYIEKPVRLDELRQALTQAVQRRKKRLLLREMEAKARFASLPDENDPACRHATRLVLRLIAQKYADPMLSVNGMAEEVRLSPIYLTNTFKEDTGRTVKRVLTEVRVEAARRLLLSTNLPIAEVAAQCGYDNANYFSKLFRQETGATPNEYREHGKEKRS